ncbi:MAG: hypothetical protein PUG48_04015, partial [Clostridia bacterium]|nr:hypothetical protein [Clostridia bacterium]
TQWQNVIKEVNAETNKNGTISIKTLANIQKKYPELIDLVNEYIAGIKSESDVISALEKVYDDDVKNYKNAVKTKMFASENFYQNLLNNNANFVNDCKDKYGIDLNNYKTAEEAKLEIKAKAEEQKRQEIANTARLEAQQKWGNMTNDPLFGDIYQNYINDAGVWSTYSPNAKKQIEQAGQNAVNAFNQSFNNLYNDFFSAYSDDAIKGLMDNGTSGDSSSKNSTNKNTWTTSNGDGIVGSGSTRAESHMDWIDKEKSLGRLSLESEIKELEKIKQYKENNADDLYEINLRLYKANQELQEQAAKKAEEAANKKKEQYALANEAYKKLADDRINAIKKVTEAAEKSADKEIAAIDRQIEARKRLNEDKSIKAEIDAINAKLNYEQLDTLSRHELERKKQELLNEQAETEWQRKMSDKKDSIQSNLSAIQEKNNSLISAYQTAATNFSNYIARLSGTQTNSQIVNNKTTNQNIKIIQNALSNDQIVRKLVNALYD